MGQSVNILMGVMAGVNPSQNDLWFSSWYNLLKPHIAADGNSFSAY